MNETVVMRLGVFDPTFIGITVEFRSHELLMQRSDLPAYFMGDVEIGKRIPEIMDAPGFRQALETFPDYLRVDREGGARLNESIDVPVSEVLEAYRQVPEQFRDSRYRNFAKIMNALDENPKLWHMDELQVSLSQYTPPSDEYRGKRIQLAIRDEVVGSYLLQPNEEEFLTSLEITTHSMPFMEVFSTYCEHAGFVANYQQHVSIAKIDQTSELSFGQMLSSFMNVNPKWIEDIRHCSYEAKHFII